jgi:valyl-tRNA synthetase
MNEVPWKSIYFTGLIRDENGQKMSKSKGNGIEPGSVIEKYGSDALRMALLFGTTPGNDVNMGEGKIGGYSKFINKLWNAAKLLQMRVLGDVTEVLPEPKNLSSDAAAWIVSEVSKQRAHVKHLMNTYQLGQALGELYSFTWDIYCDWYLEVAKVLSRDEDLAAKQELRWAAQYSFGSLLEMLHPFLPYITEDIYQKMPGLGESTLLGAAAWRKDSSHHDERPGMLHVIEIVKAIRSSKVALGGLGGGIPVAINSDPLTSEGVVLVQELARVRIVDSGQIPSERSVVKAFSRGVLTFDHPDRAGFAAKLQKEAEALKQNIDRLEGRLNSDFASRAKPEVVQAERDKLAQAIQTFARIADELKTLGGS